MLAFPAVSYLWVVLRSPDWAAYLMALCYLPGRLPLRSADPTTSPPPRPLPAHPRVPTVQAGQVTYRAERLIDQAALDPDGRADNGEPGSSRHERTTGSRINGLEHDR